MFAFWPQKAYAECVRKLILVAVLLLVVLVISWWARGSNFSILTMMQRANFTTVASSPSPHVSNAPTATPIPVEILITLTPSGFVPDVLMISPQTKITWVNKTPFNANVSLAGDFGENGSVSMVFPNAGRYSYTNGKNPAQKGTIVVK